MMLRDLIYGVFKFIGDLNYWHIVLLSALESTAFPVIIPVETVIIPMGYYAYLGTKSLPLLITSCTFGIIVGCVVNYAFARFLGRAFIYKHAKLLHINIEKLQALEAKFLKHGRLLMFVGRFVPIPAFKHIITIPAGMAKMPVGQFIFYNALGGLIFSTSMLLIGYFFGSSEELWRKALGKFVVICIILFGVYIAVRIIIKMIIKRSDSEDALTNNNESYEYEYYNIKQEQKADDILFGKQAVSEYQKQKDIAKTDGTNTINNDKKRVITNIKTKATSFYKKKESGKTHPKSKPKISIKKFTRKRGK